MSSNNFCRVVNLPEEREKEKENTRKRKEKEKT
jgi:hypothetical protein